jgi:DNA-binding transcriptional regulator YdaS (Cro superfamily)
MKPSEEEAGVAAPVDRIVRGEDVAEVRPIDWGSIEASINLARKSAIESAVSGQVPVN